MATLEMRLQFDDGSPERALGCVDSESMTKETIQKLVAALGQSAVYTIGCQYQWPGYKFTSDEDWEAISTAH